MFFIEMIAGTRVKVCWNFRKKKEGGERGKRAGNVIPKSVRKKVGG